MSKKKKRGYAKKLEDRRSGKNPRGSKWVSTPVTEQSLPPRRSWSGAQSSVFTPISKVTGGVTRIKLPQSGREVLARRINGQWHFL